MSIDAYDSGADDRDGSGPGGQTVKNERYSEENDEAFCEKTHIAKQRRILTPVATDLIEGKQAQRKV